MIKIATAQLCNKEIYIPLEIDNKTKIGHMFPYGSSMLFFNKRSEACLFADMADKELLNNKKEVARITDRIRAALRRKKYD